jgi:hypothetical protein
VHHVVVQQVEGVPELFSRSRLVGVRQAAPLVKFRHKRAAHRDRAVAESVPDDPLAALPGVSIQLVAGVFDGIEAFLNIPSLRFDACNLFIEDQTASAVTLLIEHLQKADALKQMVKQDKLKRGVEHEYTQPPKAV